MYKQRQTRLQITASLSILLVMSRAAHAKDNPLSSNKVLIIWTIEKPVLLACLHGWVTQVRAQIYKQYSYVQRLADRAQLTSNTASI